jgi:hypothetical protein
MARDARHATATDIGQQTFRAENRCRDGRPTAGPSPACGGLTPTNVMAPTNGRTKPAKIAPIPQVGWMGGLDRLIFSPLGLSNNSEILKFGGDPFIVTR